MNMGPGHLAFIDDMLGSRMAELWTKNVVYGGVTPPEANYLIDSSSNYLVTSDGDKLLIG